MQSLLIILHLFLSTVHFTRQQPWRQTTPLAPIILTPEVSLSDGSRLVGRLYTNEMFQTRDYLSIPYASVPRRFAAPVKKPSWRGVFEAVNFVDMCHQTLFQEFAYRDYPQMTFKEDCLTLNVIVPQNHTRKPSDEDNLPVMVWIHGGAFMRNSPTFFWTQEQELQGRSLASWGRVVFVSLNYRLGAFGFLYAGNKMASGNMGIKDQIMALQWIRDNIRNFGGDPNRVTLFGDEAGAASISLHMILDESRPLFSKAILQSGTALSPWATKPKEELLEKTRTLARNLSCPVNPSNDMVSCLQNVTNFRALLYGLPTYTLAQFMNHDWVPVIDGKFLKKHPLESFKSGQVKQMPALLLGNVLHECRDYYDKYIKESTGYTSSQSSKLWIQLAIPEKYNKTLLRRLIQFEYNAEYAADADLRAQYMVHEQMCSDVHFVAGTEQLAQVYANLFRGRSQVFRYVFGYGAREHEAPTQSVMQQDDLKMIFGAVPLFFDQKQQTATEADWALSRRMVRYWTNFARYGDPNINDGVSTWWEKYDSTNQYYMLIDNTETDHLERQYRSKRCSFWNKFIPEMADISRDCGIIDPKENIFDQTI